MTHRILYVSHFLPNIDGPGVEQRAARHLRSLLRIGEVTLILPEQAAERARATNFDLGALGVAEIVIRGEATAAERSKAAYDSSNNPVVRLVRSLRLRHPTDQLPEPEDRARYAQQLSGRFDLVFAFRLSSAIWTDAIFAGDAGRPPISIADFDDVESLALVRGLEQTNLNWLWRLNTSRFLTRIEQAEAHVSRTWTMVSVASPVDAARLNDVYGARLSVVPNAVPFGVATPEKITPQLRLLFVGTFSHRPNAEGVIWFVDQVWPRLRQQTPDVRLDLVGFDPCPEIVALGSRPGVNVVGPARDLAGFYDAANIVIVPIFRGSGTRIKIIESFARERAVVTTTLGCEGLDLEDRRHALIADTPDAFADAVMELWRDPALRRRLALAGAELGRLQFSPERVDADFERAVRSHLAAPADREPA